MIVAIGVLVGCRGNANCLLPAAVNNSKHAAVSDNIITGLVVNGDVWQTELLSVALAVGINNGDILTKPALNSNVIIHSRGAFAGDNQ